MAAPPPPRLSSTIELHFSCQNLKAMDALSESDPLLRVDIRAAPNAPWMELGRTEHQKNQKNPSFSKYITCEFLFEQMQDIRVTCFDLDNETPTLDDDDVVGVTFTSIGEIVGMAPNPFRRALKNPHGRDTGTLQISVEEVSTAVDFTVNLKMSARKVDKKDFFSKSDPYYTINRTREDGSKLTVLTSEVIKNSLDPKWKPVMTTAQQLCNKDLDRPMIIDVYDWDSDGGHDYIGSAMLSLRQLAEDESLRHQGVPLISEHKRQKRAKKGKSYDNSGTLIVDHCSLTRLYSFFEFLNGGTEISLMVSVDFTGSNGDPRQPRSLHYTGDPNQPNQYEQAIGAVGSILANYDTDGNFPCWGFGGSIAGHTEHCFALNGNPANPEVQGVGGILQAYKQALANVGLSGPTLFGPTLRNAMNIARNESAHGFSKYFILLLLTDGAMNDTPSAIDTIVEMSDLPISVVIVGVGNADFSTMEVLDGDQGRLRSSKGQFSERDIVQFVPFRQYAHAHPSMLAKETLAEIPGQFLAYVNKHRIAPRPPPPPPQMAPPQGGPPPQQGGPPGAPPPYDAMQNLQM